MRFASITFPYIHARFSGGMNRSKKRICSFRISMIQISSQDSSERNAALSSSTARYYQPILPESSPSASSGPSIGRRQAIALIGMGGAVGAAIISYGLTRDCLRRNAPELQPERIEPPAVKPRKLVMSEASLESCAARPWLCERRDRRCGAASTGGRRLGRTCDIRYGAQLIHMLVETPTQTCVRRLRWRWAASASAPNKEPSLTRCNRRVARSNLRRPSRHFSDWPSIKHSLMSCRRYFARD